MRRIATAYFGHSYLRHTTDGRAIKGMRSDFSTTQTTDASPPIQQRTAWPIPTVLQRSQFATLVEGAAGSFRAINGKSPAPIAMASTWLEASNLARFTR
jgi:hypothetical protein